MKSILYILSLPSAPDRQITSIWSVENHLATISVVLVVCIMIMFTRSLTIRLNRWLWMPWKSVGKSKKSVLRKIRTSKNSYIDESVNALGIWSWNLFSYVCFRISATTEYSLEVVNTAKRHLSPFYISNIIECFSSVVLICKKICNCSQRCVLLLQN